ncbi:MAG TPA: proton-conducting transporter membrane subunit [Gemmataceae bacterium]|nr:proton-conducting transporter membrane subunit [Gemmataceae bacterium]
MILLLLAIAGLALSGVPGLLFQRRSNAGQLLGVLLAVAGNALGLTASLAWFFGGEAEELVVPWSVPGGEFRVGLDGVSAWFLVPVFVVSLLGNVYGLSYWKQSEHPDTGRKLRLFYGILTAGMALLVIARNSVLFLMGWEGMALSAFFLVATEDEDQAARQAGWLYLAAAHMSALCLFAVFALLHGATGSFNLVRVPAEAISPGLAAAIFLLAVAGFGIKAGLMPLHVWLPSAHAIAPSHVSALMSGVLLKMGIYGLVRVCALLPVPPVWWGSLLLMLGAVSGVLGVVFAISQHDLKRLLAYHSIENIGIIVMALGLALLGRSLERVDWILLGLGGALLHVWNHALFKALLFLNAGAVIHAVHTRDIDHLGGLAKAMPYTALAFLVGALAICGLPPLNGFVSELLLYLGLFRCLGADGGASYVGAAFAAPALALIGALAVACFVKVYGAVFLGNARSEHAHPVHETEPAMLVPMLLLGACCFLIGLAPAAVSPLLERAVFAWSPDEVALSGLTLNGLAPFHWISAAGLMLALLIGVAGLFYWTCLRRHGATVAGTWDCGYAAPKPRMQYTSSSFAQMLVGFFSWALQPRVREQRPTGLFPGAAHFHSEVADTTLEGAIMPTMHLAARLASYCRIFQQGRIQAYLLYIFVILIVLFLWR